MPASATPAPIEDIETGEYEAEDLAAEIRRIDGYIHALTPEARTEAVARRTACIHRLAHLLLQGAPLP